MALVRRKSPTTRKEVFYADFRDPRTGKRYIRSLRTSDPAEAQIAYHELARDILNRPVSEGGVPGQATIEDIQAHAVRYFDKRNSDSSAANVIAAFRTLARHLGAGTPAASITVRDAEIWQDLALDELGLTPNTVNTYAAFMRSAWNRAIKYGIVDTNPFKDFSMLPIGDDDRVKFFRPDEINRIFDALSRHMTKLWLVAARFALHTGLREGEIVRLQPEHITPRYVTLFFRTKGRRQRQVPLSQEAKDIIQPRLDAGNEWLFPSPVKPGCHVNAAGLSRTFGLVCQRIGIQGNFHMLRHTFAATCITNGIEIYRLKEWLGHATVQTTEQYYAHLMPHTEDDLIDYVSAKIHDPLKRHDRPPTITPGPRPTIDAVSRSFPDHQDHPVLPG